MTFTLPGVYQQDVFPQPQLPFMTGVPLFIGLTNRAVAEPQLITSLAQF